MFMFICPKLWDGEGYGVEYRVGCVKEGENVDDAPESDSCEDMGVLGAG